MSEIPVQYPLQAELPGLAEAAKAEAQPDMVRVAPGVFAWRPSQGRPVPSVTLCRWARQSSGDYVPVPVGGRLCVISREVLDEIGFRGISRSVGDATLRRLAEAGEVEIVHVSPKVRMLDLDSWWRFINACIEDPEKWEPGSESWTNYMFRNALGPYRAGAGK